MSHMVIYRGSDGKPGYHQADDLGSAIKYVEHLRNDDGVERARIFRMEEVSFEFRPYYKVEIEAAGAAPDGSSDELSTLPPPPTAEWAAMQAGGEASASEPAPEAPAHAASWAEVAGGDADMAGDASVDESMTAGVGNRRGLFGR